MNFLDKTVPSLWRDCRWTRATVEVTGGGQGSEELLEVIQEKDPSLLVARRGIWKNQGSPLPLYNSHLTSVLDNPPAQ